LKFGHSISAGFHETHETATLHLVKSCCLPTLLCGCQTWCVSESELHKARASVAL